MIDQKQARFRLVSGGIESERKHTPAAAQLGCRPVCIETGPIDPGPIDNRVSAAVALLRRQPPNRAAEAPAKPWPGAVPDDRRQRRGGDYLVGARGIVIGVASGATCWVGALAVARLLLSH
jgi:hypothetical protein